MAASHPPYSEMILAAISELGAKAGSSKAKISRQISAKYEFSLKQNHYEELSAALDRMQANGQLIFSKNNYMKPDPNQPPRRGRGRPPKAKVSGTEGAGSSLAVTKFCSEMPQTMVKRGRGRPPKAKISGTEGAGSSAPKGTESSISAGGKDPGMSPKKNQDGNVASPSSLAGTSFGSEIPQAGVKRGRGRPPKVKPFGADVAGR
ncbi:hypothetical protein HPP92_023934 [Vanilla planifolia]|uniref:H15 domain-containing protein n=1 Tax=Vanilla planifolia TaxID=51239 RepID=A0A835UE82_VANPL|nr:hypothetical protein HPP92_023934 [Vanilla planifolia]